MYSQKQVMNTAGNG